MKPNRALLATIVLSVAACSDASAPGRGDVMAQVEQALATKTAPGPNSEARDYVPCEPYQKIAGLKFRTVAPKGPNAAVAIVQVDYEYTMSYLRVLDDLKAGKRAAHYGRVSCEGLDSPQWLHEHGFDQGGHFIVDGMFPFIRTDKGWQLQ